MLVYVDASPRGAWALGAARALAGLADEVALLATEDDARGDRGLLVRARAALGPPGDRAIERTVAGPAEVAIVREAREREYGLVVVPPAGRGAIARMVHGSRVATVVRSVSAPVLIARRPPERFRRVLGAVSGGGATGAVMAAARAVAATAGAAAEFVHVDDGVRLPGSERGGGSDDTAALRERMDASGGSLVWREGLVVEEILAEFEQGAWELLVVGGAAERATWAREDVTERLLLGCGGSVLVVPPGRAPGVS